MNDFSQQGSIIFSEMMTHPALFSHQKPEKVAIFGDPTGSITQEVLKHPSIQMIYHDQLSPGISSLSEAAEPIFNPSKAIRPLALDILINAKAADSHFLKESFIWLNQKGILIQINDSPFDLVFLKNQAGILQQLGFKDLLPLSFPQPGHPLGLRFALMANKGGVFKRLPEKNIFNKSFKTIYYNFNMHNAATALPEFIRENNIF